MPLPVSQSSNVGIKPTTGHHQSLGLGLSQNTVTPVVSAITSTIIGSQTNALPPQATQSINAKQQRIIQGQYGTGESKPQPNAIAISSTVTSSSASALPQVYRKKNYAE
jgi:hypothetical protein